MLFHVNYFSAIAVIPDSRNDGRKDFFFTIPEMNGFIFYVIHLAIYADIPFPDAGYRHS